MTQAPAALTEQQRAPFLRRRAAQHRLQNGVQMRI
jgi:hypothetical protein